MKLFASCAILSTCISFVGCDALDAPKMMKEMKETTQDMKETTESMEETTGTMFLEIRSKEGRDTRLKEINNMEASETFYNKTLSAAAYFKGFEYQLYTYKTDLENNAYFEDLKYAAVKEFMRQANDYLDKTPAEDMSPTAKDETAQNFMALAVAMHEVHDFHLKLHRERGIAKVDMLKLLQDGMAVREAYNNYEINLEEHDYRLLVLQNHDAVEALLQARVDMLSGMIVSRVSDINKDYSNIFVGIPEVVNKLGKLFRKWESNFKEIERAKRDETLAWTREAVRTRNIISSLGMKYEMNKTLKRVFKNMRRSPTVDISIQSNVEEAEFNRLMADLIGEDK